MEMVFGECAGATKRRNDGSSSMSLGHGKRSRPWPENFDISTSSASHEAQLDAFACPEINAEEGECNTFFTTMKLLDEAKINCGKLQDQLREKDEYYLQREKQLEEFYRGEIAREKEILARNQYFALKQSIEYAAELKAKDKEIADKNQELCAAQEREFGLKEEVWELCVSEKALRDRLKRTENSFFTLLKFTKEREKQWQELKSLRASENRERELRDEISSRSSDENRDRRSSAGPSITRELSRLESEVNCLRCCLLTISQEEILNVMYHAEENAVLRVEVSTLESSERMLKSELAYIKTDYNLEKVLRKHLSAEYEILKNLFKKSLENPHAVKATINEMKTMNMSMSWLETSTQRSERDEELPVTGERLLTEFTTAESSPQESPVTSLNSTERLDMQ